MKINLDDTYLRNLNPKRNELKKTENLYALVISILIFFSFPPWPLWGVKEFNTRIISLFTLFVAFNIITTKSIRTNLPIAIMYLFSMLIISFGGLKGYTLPSHVELAMFVFLLSFSRKFLISALIKFEKLIAIVFILGIATYIASFIIDLPHFSIKPLNKLKDDIYQVYIFELRLDAYTLLGGRRFMSVFDEPGVVGSMLALLISYKKLKFDNYRDYVLIITGLISFSLAFYVVLIINIFYYKYLNWKFLIIFIGIVLSFYYIQPQFIQETLLDRFVSDGEIGVVDNRSSQLFSLAYDEFIRKGGDQVIFGLGPNSLERLSKTVDLNVSSYKTIVYQWGYLGLAFFVFFFFVCTLQIARTQRGFFYLFIFLLIGWQRPAVFRYFNMLIFLGGLSYISVSEIVKKGLSKKIHQPV
jgi:hypothetical protein